MRLMLKDGFSSFSGIEHIENKKIIQLTLKGEISHG